jgi:hypothetical protein
VRRGAPGLPRDDEILLFSSILYVLFFKAATKLLGQIVTELFGPKCLIKGSVGYLFLPKGTVNKLLRH